MPVPHNGMLPHQRHSSLRVLLIGFAILIQSLLPVYAQTSESQDRPALLEGLSANEIVNFAEQLIREGEYFRAITEYRRFLFSFPRDPRRPMVHFYIGLAFYRGQRYTEALQIFREVAQHYPETVYGKHAWLWQGESLMRQAQYGAAEQVFTETLKKFSQDETRQHARYQKGWTLLYTRQWRKAAEQFQHVPSESPLHHAAQRLAEEALDGNRLPRKSPALAGFLSGLLPGAGQLYNGRLGDALLAFFLNGLFVVGITEAVQNKEFAVAGVLSFFEAGWYTGNVYGAVNGTHKHNRHIVETFIRNLENRFRLPPPDLR